MPAYVIDFLSGEGPQRRRFTLDDDRPLRGQLAHVLAELERTDVVLRGSPTDELAVYWAGRELDADATPHALGVTADRPLELRMQRRRPAVTLPAPPPEPPPERFVPKGVYAGTALGLAAGALAYGVAALVTDRTAFVRSDARVDAAAGLAWGALVGGTVGWGQARRAGAGAGWGVAKGLAAGALAAAAWGLVRDVAAQPTAAPAVVGWRVGLWALLAAAVAGALAGVVRAPGVRATEGSGAARPVAALARAAGWAALAGAAAGLLGAFPGEAALWQALAAALAGAGVGGAVAWAGAHEATAVLELEARVDARGERPVGVASLREWALTDGAVAYLGAAPGAEGHAPALVCEGGRCHFHPDAGATGAGARPARELRHGERLVLGAGRYRFRRRAVAA